MRLNEVDRQEEITEAGEIVQKMFRKKHMAMSWDSGSKPTIRGLVQQLDDPFLTSLTKSLDFFIHYGSLWLDLNPNDIFSSSSETSNVNDMMKDPEYFRNQKGMVYEIVKMRPTMYAIHAKHGFNTPDHKFIPDPDIIIDYALKVLSGSKMPIPYLKYELVQSKFKEIVVNEYTAFSQEGRHRATVASTLGADLIPCVIIAQTTGDLKQYSNKIFNDFK